MCHLCFVLQAHAGVAGGSISNPVDMETFKRQQAMVQAGRATLAAQRWKCFFLFSFLIPSFCFFLLSLCFSPPICFCLLGIPASFPSSVFNACNPENGDGYTLMCRNHCHLPTAFFFFLLSVVLFCIVVLGGRCFAF